MPISCPVYWLCIRIMGLLLLQITGSRVYGLSSCGTWAYLPYDMWNLLTPGIEPLSPALAGRFSTTGPPGKSVKYFLLLVLFVELVCVFLLYILNKIYQKLSTVLLIFSVSLRIFYNYNYNCNYKNYSYIVII